MRMKTAILVMVAMMFAAAVCSQSPSSNPAAIRLLNDGDMAFERKDYEKAIRSYTEAIRLDSNNAEIYGGEAWPMCPFAVR